MLDQLAFDGIRARHRLQRSESYAREDPTECFAVVEAIMSAFDDRPYRGRMHRRVAFDLRPEHPRFDDFLAIRDKLDPDRLFANDYLRKVLGE